MQISVAANDYRERAKTKFNCLKLVCQIDNSFWKQGNAFDTMIDFLDTIDHSDASEVEKIVEERYKATLQSLGGYDKAWFDDFGWWTIAAQRAVGKSFFSPDFKKVLVNNITSNCWTRFTENAPHVWVRREPDSYNNCRPAVEGGVWNEYWSGTPSEFPGPKDGDPTVGNLQGIQNSVTNALYLMAAQHLDPTAASREYKFLVQWFEAQKDPLWWKRSSEKGTGALIRERVSHFFDGSKAPGFQEDWVWAGDQGLILGALCHRIGLASPIERPLLLDRVEELLEGARLFLVDEKGVLDSYTKTGYPPDDDESDYKTGRGVFWRNVLYCWKSNDDLRAFLSQQCYQDFVQASAEAVNETNDFVELTNDVAVLVAATAILE